MKWTLSAVLDAIKSNQSIIKLEVKKNSTIDVKMDELNRFAVEHPLIVELIFSEYQFGVNDATHFIREMKLLKRIEFKVNARAEFDRLLSQLSNEMFRLLIFAFSIKLNR